MASKSAFLKVEFSDKFYKKLGLQNSDGFEAALDKAVDHGLSDAENIIKREVPRPGHSMSSNNGNK